MNFPASAATACGALLATVAIGSHAQMAADEIITSEWRNKVTLQGGYGPEDSLLGADREAFYSLRYEPTFIWYSPEKRWPRWQVVTRGWLAYDSSSAATPLREENEQQIEGLNAEVREFYVRRNLLAEDVRFSATLGRQRFSDRLGIWWDDTIEAARLDYVDDFARGFVAVGQKFYNYNTDLHNLDPREEDIFYAMGEYALRWDSLHWAGLRLMYENDHSERSVEDPNDFEGIRYGLFATGRDLELGFLTDYHVELAAVDGERKQTTILGTTDTDISGWAVLGEVGHRWHEAPWRPRLVLRAGMTDKPGEESDGFYLNRLQSDRLINPYTYSTRMVSSFIRLDIRNLAYYGIGVESEPSPRTALDVRVSDLKLRNRNSPLPIRTTAVQDTTSSSVGQVLDINYYWQSFPSNYRGRRFNMNTLVSASYFKAGEATGDLDDEFQVSVGLVMHY